MGIESLPDGINLSWCDHCQNDPHTRWGTTKRGEPNLSLYYHRVHGRTGVSCKACYEELSAESPNACSVLHKEPGRHNIELIDEFDLDMDVVDDRSAAEVPTEIASVKTTDSTESPASLQATETSGENRA